MEAPSTQVDRESLVNQIKNSSKAEVNLLMKSIIKEELQQEKDLQKIREFFTYIYDNLYHDIIFQKIHIRKPIVYTLEKLAMPIYDTTIIENILKKR